MFDCRNGEILMNDYGKNLKIPTFNRNRPKRLDNSF